MTAARQVDEAAIFSKYVLRWRYGIMYSLGLLAELNARRPDSERGP